MRAVWQKRKEIEISDEKLEAALLSKLRGQKGVCKLTGLKMNFDSHDADPNLLPSVDRIDSNGPYSIENIQVVCRFANFWKSASTDEEVKRLLGLVRGKHSQ